MLIQLEQIQNIPINLFKGIVQFFNQNVVTVCNSTNKTLLGSFQFDTDLGYPPLNRVASVTGYGQWQTSSATNPDTLYFSAYAKDGQGNIISLINRTVQRSQLDFATGHFLFELKLDVMTADLVTLSLNYSDTKGVVIETDEYTSGVNLSTQKVFVEVYGQMAVTQNPVFLNAPIISSVNLVQNPSFESDLDHWNTDPNHNTTTVPDPNTGNSACDIFGGINSFRIDQASSISTNSVPASFLYQSGIFQTGKVYYIEFYSKNVDAIRYASNVSVPGLIAQPNTFSDNTQSLSIIGVYAYNTLTAHKIQIGTVKTGKAYTKSSFVFTAVPGYDAIYFDMAPASFASTSVFTAQGNLYRQVLQQAGIPIIVLPFDPDFTAVFAQNYLMSLHIRLDDVRVSEIVPTIINPLNMTTKEIRLRDLTIQYIS